MADLENIAKLLKVKLNPNVGKKRRPWLVESSGSLDSNQGAIGEQLGSNKVAIGEQLENNKETIGEQLENNKETIGEQLENNKETIGEQLENNKETIGEQLENNKETIGEQLENNKETIGEQLGNKLENKQTGIALLIRGLSGLQKKLLNYVFVLCLERDELNTGQISTATVSGLIGCSHASAKVSFARLEKKGVLERVKGKRGVGGFVTFRLSKEIKLLMINNTDGNKRTIREQLGNELGNKLENNQNSSSSIYKTTTTNDEQLFEELENINIKPLGEIGFTKDHLSQIVLQMKLPPEKIQISIDAFAFDLKENKKSEKIKEAPLSFFMGILRNNGSYLPPPNYKTPQEVYMLSYAQRMEELETQKQEIEKRAFDAAFNEWFSQLTDEKKKSFLPKGWSSKSAVRLENNKILEGAARNHFKQELWADKKKEIIEQGMAGVKMESPAKNQENV